LLTEFYFGQSLLIFEDIEKFHLLLKHTVSKVPKPAQAKNATPPKARPTVLVGKGAEPRRPSVLGGKNFGRDPEPQEVNGDKVKVQRVVSEYFKDGTLIVDPGQKDTIREATLEEESDCDTPTGGSPRQIFKGSNDLFGNIDLDWCSVMPVLLEDKMEREKVSLNSDHKISIADDARLTFLFIQLRRFLHYSSFRVQTTKTVMNAWNFNQMNEYHPEPIYKFSAYQKLTSFHLNDTVKSFISGRHSQIAASLKTLLFVAEETNQLPYGETPLKKPNTETILTNLYPTTFIGEEDHYTDSDGKLKVFMKIPNAPLMHSI
jgi:hypothetical protein